jgi:hypothetical protein
MKIKDYMALTLPQRSMIDMIQGAEREGFGWFAKSAGQTRTMRKLAELGHVEITLVAVGKDKVRRFAKLT